MIYISLDVDKMGTLSFFALIIIGEFNWLEGGWGRRNGTHVTIQTLPTMYELQVLSLPSPQWLLNITRPRQFYVKVMCSCSKRGVGFGRSIPTCFN